MFTNNLGFRIIPEQLGSDIDQAEIGRVQNPLTDEGIRRRDMWPGHQNSREEMIQRMITRAQDAYLIDGFIKFAVDRYSEFFTDIAIDGGREETEYLSGRIARIALQSGEAWPTLVDRIVCSYFRTGNVFILKVRGDRTGTLAKRPLYEEKPHPICALYLVDPAWMAPEYVEGIHVGWRIKKDIGKEKLKLVIPGSPALDRSQALVRASGSDVPAGVLTEGVDLIHIAAKAGPESPWGIGVTFPVLEDTALLRTIEQSVATLIKKNIFPTVHHKINKPSNPVHGISADIQKAVMLHRMAAPEGVIITGPDHEIRTLGAESQALRVEGYLDYFRARVLTGLGMPVSVAGLGGGARASLESAVELVLSKVRHAMSTISKELEWWLLNELLWEGGFDPYLGEGSRVHLRFSEIDQDAVIRLRTQLLALYQGNMISFEEARRMGGIPPGGKRGDFFLDRVQIPLMLARQGLVGGEDARSKGVRSRGGGGMGGSRGGRKEDPSIDEGLLAGMMGGVGPVLGSLSRLGQVVPSTEQEVNELVDLLVRDGLLDSSEAERVRERMFELLGDYDGLLEYLVSLFSEPPIL